MKVSQKKLHRFRQEFIDQIAQHCSGLGLQACYVNLRGEVAKGVFTIRATSAPYFDESASLRVGSLDKRFLERLRLSFQSRLEMECIDRKIGLSEACA